MANKNGTRKIDTNKTDAIKKRFLEIYLKTNNISRACAACDISRSTFYEWKSLDAKFASDFENTEEAMLDSLEEQAQQMAKEVPAVLIFLLKTKGKKRGYIEKTETEHSGNLSVNWNEEKTYESPAQ